VRRVGKHIQSRAHFRYTPCIEDRDRITGLRHNPHVMRNHQHRGTVIPAQVAQKVQYLGLDGYIQRGCRFISNQELRPA
jgi:hypothetical protein